MPNKIERRSIQDIIDQYNSNNSKKNKGELAPHAELLTTTAPPSRRIDVTRNLVKDLIAKIESGDRSTPQTPKNDYRRTYSTPNQKVTVEADMVKARVQQFMKVEPKTTETAQNQPLPTKRLSLPARNENFASLRKNFEVKQSETIELNESEDEELIEFNFSQIVAKLAMEANYDEVDEDLDVAFSSAVESVYIFDNKQETNKIDYKEELHEGHVNNYEIIIKEAVNFDPPANSTSEKNVLLDDPKNAMIPSDSETYLYEGGISDLEESNQLNMDELTIEIEEKFEEILYQYGIVDSTRSDVILEEKIEEEFEVINYDPSLLADEGVLEDIVNEIVSSNDGLETKVEFEDSKDIETNGVEIVTYIKEESVEKIELGDQPHEKAEDGQISIETFADYAIQKENVESFFEIKNILSEQFSTNEVETVPEDLNLGYEELDADETEECTKLSITDIIKRFEGKNDDCKMTGSSLGNIRRNISYYDPTLLAEEILVEIVNEIAWSNDDFETKMEFEDTKDIKAISIETTTNLKEENVDKIDLGYQAHEETEDSQASIETYDDCVIQNEDAESPSKIKSISNAKLSSEEVETIPENLDLEYENLEADENEEWTKLSVADIIKRFEGKNDDCKMTGSSLGNIRRNISYYDPTLLAEEILEEIVSEIAWSNDDFKTKVEFKHTKDTEANGIEIITNVKEENIEKIEFRDQAHEEAEDGQISIETYDYCVIQNDDVESLSEVKNISNEILSAEENLDLGCENLEADKSHECTKPSIADIIKRFESKNDDCKVKRSSLGDIRTNSTYFFNRAKRRSSSADIKVEIGDKQDDIHSRKSDNNDNETVKLSVKELKNIFDRRKEEYQNINQLRKKLVHSEAITYAPKILDDIILEEKMEVENDVEIVEFEEDETEKQHRELLRFYRDLFEHLGNPLFILTAIYCSIYLLADFIKLLLYICYKMIA